MKSYIGNCADLFDPQTGEALRPISESIWDVNSFAAEEEKAQEITKEEFFEKCFIPVEFCFSKDFLFLESTDSEVFWAYDFEKDIHYFFV